MMKIRKCVVHGITDANIQASVYNIDKYVLCMRRVETRLIGELLIFIKPINIK